MIDCNHKTVFISVILLLLLWMLFQLIIRPVYTYIVLPKYALFKAEDPNNIIEGCAYYSGKYKTKYGEFYEYHVDDLNLTSHSGLTIDFPFKAKRGKFVNFLELQRNECIKVKYITINYLFFKRNYIYDVFY